MELSYESLRSAQLEERHDPSLKALPEDYYSSYGGYLKRLQDKLSNNFNLNDAKAFENSAGVFNSLFERRKQKIVFKALKDASNEVLDGEGLTKQEKRLYSTLVQVFNDYDGERASISRVKSSKPSSSGVRVKVLMDLPQFVGVDNASYGPYSKGTEVALPDKIAALLLKRKAAEKR